MKLKNPFQHAPADPMHLPLDSDIPGGTDRVHLPGLTLLEDSEMSEEFPISLENRLSYNCRTVTSTLKAAPRVQSDSKRTASRVLVHP